MTDMSPGDWFDLGVRIKGGEVYFGDTKLPGVIADGGVVFTPGERGGFNRLSVTFFVGELKADDPSS